MHNVDVKLEDLGKILANKVGGNVEDPNVDKTGSEDEDEGDEEEGAREARRKRRSNNEEAND